MASWHSQELQSAFKSSIVVQVRGGGNFPLLVSMPQCAHTLLCARWSQ